MEAELAKYIIMQGPFAGLFLWLLLHVMKTNREREKEQAKTNNDRETRLQALLDKFSEKYDVIISEIRDIKGRFK